MKSELFKILSEALDPRFVEKELQEILNSRPIPEKLLINLGVGNGRKQGI